MSVELIINLNISGEFNRHKLLQQIASQQILGQLISLEAYLYGPTIYQDTPVEAVFYPGYIGKLNDENSRKGVIDDAVIADFQKYFDGQHLIKLTTSAWRYRSAYYLDQTEELNRLEYFGGIIELYFYSSRIHYPTSILPDIHAVGPNGGVMIYGGTRKYYDPTVSKNTGVLNFALLVKELHQLIAVGSNVDSVIVFDIDPDERPDHYHYVYHSDLNGWLSDLQCIYATLGKVAITPKEITDTIQKTPHIAGQIVSKSRPNGYSVWTMQGTSENLGAFYKTLYNLLCS